MKNRSISEVYGLKYDHSKTLGCFSFREYRICSMHMTAADVIFRAKTHPACAQVHNHCDVDSQTFQTNKVKSFLYNIRKKDVN